MGVRPQSFTQYSVSCALLNSEVANAFLYRFAKTRSRVLPILSDVTRRASAFAERVKVRDLLIQPQSLIPASHSLLFSFYQQLGQGFYSRFSLPWIYHLFNQSRFLLSIFISLVLQTACHGYRQP